MLNIYLKSVDEHTVVKLSNPHVEPKIAPYDIEKGYKVIGYVEFKKIRRKIQRGAKARLSKSEGGKVEREKRLLQK